MKTANKYFLLFLFVGISSAFSKVLIPINTSTNSPISSSKSFVSNKDVFGKRVFVENKGQFDKNLKAHEKILFVYDDKGEKIYFTPKGLIYELVEPLKMDEEALEKMEKNGHPETNQLKKYYVYTNWLGSNQEGISVEASQKQSHYFTYGGPEYNSSTFKKITYKNVYPNIDIEYFIPEDKEYGVKYNLLLHVGAEVKDIKIAYSGDLKKMNLQKNGDIVIKTAFDTIIEHAPKSFYRGGDTIASEFVLNKNVISFNLQLSNKQNQEIVIDPWVTVITTLNGNNYGYDVDYDNNGNVFVFGGNFSFLVRCGVAKYNSLGILQWTFSGSLVLPPWNSSAWIGNFKVDPVTGKLYIGKGIGGQSVVRLDANGNYDNYMSLNSMSEVWGIDFSCSGDIIIYGPGPSVQIFNQNTGLSMGIYFFHPVISDICSGVRDDLTGNSFVIYTSNNGTNWMSRLNAAQTSTIWTVPAGYSVLNYGGNKTQYVGGPFQGSMSFNALALSSNYLYYYDGLNLAAYDKTNGSMLGSTVIQGHLPKQQGGIAVDDCNNIYIGSNNSILTYSFNGTIFLPTATIPLNVPSVNKYVYDIKLDKLNNVLYVSGSGFVGTYSATPSLSCALVNVCSCVTPVLTVNTTSTICANIGTSSVTSVLGMTGPYTYTWLPGGQNTPSITGLNPGTYTVIVYSNSCNTTASAVTVFSPGVPGFSLSTPSTSITCASPGSATASIQYMPGPFSYTWLPSGQTGSVATGLSPGTYTLLVYSGGCNYTFSNTTTFNSMIPLSGNFNSSPSITCNGASTGTASVTNIAGGSPSQNYLWINGNVSYTNQPLVTGLSAGVWTVTVTDALTGCVTNSVFTIAQPPLLTLNIAAGSSTACAGHPTSFTASASGGVGGFNYNWVNGSAGNTHTVIQNTGGVYIYTVSVFDANNCGLSNTISISYTNNPVLTVSNVSICPFQTGTLTVSGANTYTWNNNLIGNTFTDNPLFSTQYTVVGSVSGCTTAANPFIILKQIPNPVISSNSPVCETATLNLSCNSGTAYVWSGPNGFVSNTANNSINPVTLNASGLYQVTVTAANSCTAAASASVLIKPLPLVAIAPNSPSICANTTSVLLNAVGTATLFNWAPALGLSSTTLSSVNAFPAATKIYTLTGTLNGCVNKTTITVNVVPPPALAVSLSSNSLCAQAFNGSPNSITLTASGAATYTLNTPTHFLNPNPGGPVSPLTTQSPSPIIAGPATATLYGSNGVCTLSTTAVFTIIPNPTVGLNSYTPVICAGQSFTYTSSGASSYTWSAATPGQTLYTTGNIAVANPSINSVFSVFGGSLGCNSALQTSTLTVYSLPILAVTPNSSSICIAKQTTLNVTGANTYVWYKSQSQYGSGSAILVYAGLTPTTNTYKVIGTSVNNCTAEVSATVNTLPLPIPSLEILPGNTICLNNTITLKGYGGNYYTWNSPNNLQLNGQQVQLLANNLAFAGNYQLTVTDAKGCSNYTTTTLHINNLPGGNLLAQPAVGCVPFWSNLKFVAAQGSAAITSQNWKINESQFTSNTFMYFFKYPGKQTITGTLHDVNGCNNDVTVIVEANETPVANFTYLPEKPVENLDKVIFSNQSTGQKQQSWNWFFINNDKKNQYEAENVSYFFQNAGTYPVAMIVKNDWGCEDSVVKYIKIEPDFNVFVPNVFTPNNDGLNDVFVPIVRGVKLYKLLIYNRWGQAVFETNDAVKGWDGFFNGEACQQDVYNWKIDVSSLGGEQKILTGRVTLYR